ncbi:MAG TPA: DUF3618 domain-containing protein [Gammaproteobacteria bacterium]|nr:DUF3618 domain-containing protein [Gammaproteobacteria bacterium]
MSSTMDDLRHDVRKDPDELAREADSARHAVEGTLSELEQRLSPGQMLDRVMDAVKEHGGEFGENLLAQVRNNPLPTLFAGIGIAWLMASSKTAPRSAGYDRSRMGDGDGMSSAFDSARGTASSTFDSARDTASAAYDSTKNAAMDAMGATRAAASGAADAAGQAAHRVADVTRRTMDTMAEASRTGAATVTDLYREQPLVLGAVAIVAGAALGAMLPSTRAEDGLLGDIAEETKTRLKSEVDARTAGLRDAAADAVENVKDAVKDTAGQGQAMRKGGSQKQGRSQPRGAQPRGSQAQSASESPRRTTPQSQGDSDPQKPLDGGPDAT